MAMDLDPALLAEVARRALDEDGAWQDVTTSATVEPQQRGQATVLAKGEGVLAGLQAMAAVFAAVDPSLRCTALKADGDCVRRGDQIATVAGSYASILR